MRGSWAGVAEAEASSVKQSPEDEIVVSTERGVHLWLGWEKRLSLMIPIFTCSITLSFFITSSSLGGGRCISISPTLTSSWYTCTTLLLLYISFFFVKQSVSEIYRSMFYCLKLKVSYFIRNPFGFDLIENKGKGIDFDRWG